MTLGCDKNTVDSEKMMAALVGHGARVSSDLDGADVVVVNTCGFIESAKEESIETILEACRLKEEGRVRAVVAVGCMVQRYKEELRAEIPEVDLFLGLSEMASLIPELRRGGFLPESLEDVPTMERPLRILATATPHTSFLKISEGCDHTCAFCAIPSFRGLHRSAPLPELVTEARALVAETRLESACCGIPRLERSPGETGPGWPASYNGVDAHRWQPLMSTVKLTDIDVTPLP